MGRLNSTKLTEILTTTEKASERNKGDNGKTTESLNVRSLYQWTPSGEEQRRRRSAVSCINRRRANLETGRAAGAVQTVGGARQEVRSVERGCCNDRSVCAE